MRSPGPAQRAASCSIFVAFLAGCSGIGSSSSTVPLSQLAPQARTVSRSSSGLNIARADAAPEIGIIESDPAGQAVVAYTAGGKLVKSIKNLTSPSGVALDSAGDIYVANATDVLVYKNDYKTLIATLTDSGLYPGSVAIYPATGLVGVTSTRLGGQPGTVSFFAKGKTTQCRILAVPWGGFFGVFDTAGDFYVSGYKYEHGHSFIGVVHGGCAATSITQLSTGNKLAKPGPLQITHDGKIAISDGATAAVYTYGAPVKNALGSPLTVTRLVGSTSNPDGYGGFAFSNDDDYLWLADGSGKTLKYAYPAGGAVVQTIESNDAKGIAIRAQ